ncbi:MAG: DnaA family protein [Gammaproteobacteria bacterium]|jgi:DnaA family protein
MTSQPRMPGANKTHDHNHDVDEPMTKQMRGVRQLALGVAFNASRRFSNFVPAGNEAVLGALDALLRGHSSGHVYLSGGAGIGKTHLLQACCAFAADGGERVAYLPMGERSQLDESLLRDLEQARVVCVDDVDRVAHDPRWERAVFSLYNDADLAGVPMIFAGRKGPDSVGLADLRSRLTAALRLELIAPDDTHRAAVLAQRAADLGFELGADVQAYVLARQPRNLADLTSFVESLDRYALAAKRRVTVALVREFLAG